MAKLLLLACLAGTMAWAADPAGMVLIPAGEFLRGRAFAWSDYDVAWYPNPAKDDQPVRTIKLNAYSLDVSEVTQAQYAAFVKATGHAAPYNWREGKMPEDRAKYPVADVSWEDANAFCSWAGKRLPTEAEWERAAGPDRDLTSKDAVYNQVNGPSPVCTKSKNESGLCDMIGNVWEWCGDWYGREYYRDAPAENPKGPEKGMYRVLRGGSWFDVPKLFLSTSYRSWARPGERSPTIGFRCAKPVTP